MVTIAEKLTQGLNSEVGYVLALNFGVTKWITSKWEFRRNHLFLSAGNSPLGLRLPLESLIVKPPVEIEKSFETDLFAFAPQLGDYIKEVKKRGRKKNVQKMNFEGQSASGTLSKLRERKAFASIAQWSANPP